MDIDFAFAATPSAAESYSLEELSQLLRETDFTVKSRRAAPKPGVKDGGLLLGLTVTAAGVSATAAAINTLCSVITFWRSKQNYTLTIEKDGTKFSANNLTAKELQPILASLKDKGMASDARFIISRH